MKRESKHQNQAGMLELSGRKFKTTTINTLRTLMNKTDSMQEHVSKEMQTPRKNQKEMLDIKKKNLSQK